MIRSLRFRILAWYTISLTLTVSAFGGFLYWRMRESRISEMDLELRGAGQTLLKAVNTLHDFELEWDKPLGSIPDIRDMQQFMPPPEGRGGGERRGGRGFGRGGGAGGRPGDRFGERQGSGPPESRRYDEEGFPIPEPDESPRESTAEPPSEKTPSETAPTGPLKPRPDLESKSPLEEKLIKASAQAEPAEPQRRDGPPRERGGRTGPGLGPGGGWEPPGERGFGEFGSQGRGFDRRGPGGFGIGPGDGPGGPGDFEFRDRGPPPGFVEEIEKNERNVALPTIFERNIEVLEGEKPFFVIWRKNGSIMKASSGASPQGLHAAKTLSPTSEGVIRTFGDYRELWIAGPSESTIFVRRKAAKLNAELTQWLWGIIGAGVGVLVFGIAGGSWMSYGVLRSIRAMNYEASRLSEQNLSQRISTRGVDTELTVLAKTLNRALARLESAFSRQRQFTGDASHELRTPLTVVMGNLELALQDTSLRADAKRSLEAALRAAKRMRGLTDQLLMLAKADAGALELKRSEFDLGDIIQECAELVRPMAEKKQVRLEVDAPSTEIEGDAGLLSQVVINLLSNAIQYNKTGGNVHIGLSDSGDSVELQVSDTGVGIPEEARSRLFERFYRPDGSRNRQSGGNGLGLAISKSLVEAHGGKITFDSAVGTGTEFRVLLPRC
jgi:two-component system OmpR family sensor kinase